MTVVGGFVLDFVVLGFYLGFIMLNRLKN